MVTSELHLPLWTGNAEIYFLNAKWAFARKHDIFTREDNMLSSRVKIWCFRAKAHLVFHWCNIINLTHSLRSLVKYFALSRSAWQRSSLQFCLPYLSLSCSVSRHSSLQFCLCCLSLTRSLWRSSLLPLCLFILALCHSLSLCSSHKPCLLPVALTPLLPFGMIAIVFCFSQD